MRLFLFLLGVILVCVSFVLCYLGMVGQFEELYKMDVRQVFIELIGDFKILSDSQFIVIGKVIKSIFVGDGDLEDLILIYIFILLFGILVCIEDKCCVWKYIFNEMCFFMVGLVGRCINVVCVVVCLGFYDVGIWLKSINCGGVDGLIIFVNECENRSENDGFEEICVQMRIWYNKYKSYGISMVDLI